MTPKAMLSKYFIDGAYFLGDLDNKSLWDFLSPYGYDVVSSACEDESDYEHTNDLYNELHFDVVAELRGRYDTK